MRKGRDKNGNTAAGSIISVPVVLPTNLELSARMLILQSETRKLTCNHYDNEFVAH